MRISDYLALTKIKYSGLVSISDETEQSVTKNNPIYSVAEVLVKRVE